MRRVLSVAVVAAIASLIVVPAAAGWVWPADGPVLRPFSLAEDAYAAGQHRGIDIGAAAGGAVRAPAAGTVSFAGAVPGGGRALTIQTADGYAVTLLQLGSIAVTRGSTVAEGAIVGEVGASEDAVTRAPHVHLGVRVASDANGYVDPALLLPARPPLTTPEPAPVASPEPAPPAVVVPEPPTAEVGPVVTPAPAEAAVAEPVAVEPTRSAATPRAASVARTHPERPFRARPFRARPFCAGSLGAVSACPHRVAALPECPPDAGSESQRPGGGEQPGHRLRRVPPSHRPCRRCVPSNRARATAQRRPAARRTTRSGLPLSRARREPRLATDGSVSPCSCSQAPRWRPGSRPRSPGGLHLSLTAMSFYLTTPIYYVNATPHIGHAYTTIIGDILVRHHRQRGERTYFLTGVDEHADKVARVAKEQGLTPREYVDQIVGAWQELPERVNASIDFFIRTTDDGHKAFVQDFLQKIYDNGDVYQDVYAGLYCVGCEAFKTEAELVDGKCPDHGIVPEWLEEKNWFFRLSAYQDRLLQLYDERPDFVLPAFRSNEARSFIAGGLRDFSISRATQTWGIPIPWDPDQVAYVWADALINYLSALSYAPGADLGLWPAKHLLAKDILRFHCVYWPALLLSAGYEPPRQLFVHGYLNLDNRKISKSLGNVLDPLDLVDEYGVDPVRFWVARVVPFGQDGDVTLDSFRERYERELANDLGNLLSRTTAMIARYRDGDLTPAPNEKRRARRRRS